MGNKKDMKKWGESVKIWIHPISFFYAKPKKMTTKIDRSDLLKRFMNHSS